MKEIIEIFFTFFRMGAFTIGGGIAMLPLIQHTIVDKKGWLDDEEMANCFAISQALPGVIAINSATYIGKKKKGIPGAFAASLGVIMPSFIIIIAASILLVSIGENKYIEGAFTGIKAASCGLITFAAYRMGKQVIKDWKGIVIVVSSIIVVVIFGISAIWPILFGAIWGFFYLREV